MTTFDVRRTTYIVQGAFALVVVASSVRAQGSPADSIPAHDSFTVTSKALGEKRLINVHVPAAYAQGARFPVLVMPDGGIDEDFPHVVRTVDSLIAAKAIRPVVVVGIPNTERRRDLTGPTRVQSDSAIAKRVGGSAAFRKFIRDELLPAVKAKYRVTDERSIVGESLAGLFIVETFLRDPTMFSHYVALDPSVWWNKGSLVDSAAVLMAKHGAAPRLLFLRSSKDDIDGLTTTLAAALKAAPPPGLIVDFKSRPDLTHATIFLGVQVEALAAALR